MSGSARATQSGPLRAGAFLVCWLPFFVLNVVKALCAKRVLLADAICSRTSDATVNAVVVFLGYVNSCPYIALLNSDCYCDCDWHPSLSRTGRGLCALRAGINPIIYAVWNAEFRRAFLRLLRLAPCGSRGRLASATPASAFGARTPRQRHTP